MNLDQELRATLGREAELRTAPPPDVAGIISGGRVRRRRRNMARVGVAAAVTVLVAGAAYGVTQLDRSDPRTGPGIAGTPTQPSEPATIPPPLPDGAGARPPLEPGSTYRVLVGTDTAFDKIEADWTVEGPNWVGGDYAIVSDGAGETYAGFGVYQPHALADGTGCIHDEPNPNLDQTPQGLAAQLATLPRSTVVEPPTSTKAFGYDAFHLRLRIDVDCPGWYRVAEAASGDRGITYGVDDIVKDVVIDFWVLDLGGPPVVVDEWHNIDAPPELVDKATQARESITFVTSE